MAPVYMGRDWPPLWLIDWVKAWSGDWEACGKAGLSRLYFPDSGECEEDEGDRGEDED